MMGFHHFLLLLLDYNCHLALASLMKKTREESKSVCTSEEDGRERDLIINLHKIKV